MPTDLVVPPDIIERQIGEVEALIADWEQRLADATAEGSYRLRINDHWEASEQANARMQAIIGNLMLDLQNLLAFRAVWQTMDS